MRQIHAADIFRFGGWHAAAPCQDQPSHVLVALLLTGIACIGFVSLRFGVHTHLQGADRWIADRLGGRVALHYAAIKGRTAVITALLAGLPDDQRRR